MRFGSVCSGIETVSLAMPQWSPRWFSEIDPYCCALLKHKYPETINHGDITKADITKFSGVDVVVAGTPCQSFSVQGKREGLGDSRGDLAIRFGELMGEIKPQWIVWENVPGVLTSNRGADFGCFLRTLGKLGYGFAYRVLDAQHFGVPQRRRRVFVVAHLGKQWQRPAAVLFDGAQFNSNAGQVEEIRKKGISVVEANRVCLGWTGDETPKHGINVVPTLKASQGGEGVGIAYRGIVRRLTVREWERLQGIPDGYTELGGWGDGARKKAIGNAFCVPVIRWICERLEYVDGIDG